MIEQNPFVSPIALAMAPEGATLDPGAFDVERVNQKLAAAVANEYRAWWVGDDE